MTIKNLTFEAVATLSLVLQQIIYKNAFLDFLILFQLTRSEILAKLEMGNFINKISKIFVVVRIVNSVSDIEMSILRSANNEYGNELLGENNYFFGTSAGHLKSIGS